MEVNIYKRISVLLVLMMVISTALAACGVEEGGEVVTSSKIEGPVYPGVQPGPDKLKPGLDHATEEFKGLSPGFNVESNLYLIPTATDDEVYEFFAPGNAPECIALFNPHRNQLFTGDFINIGELYAFLPEPNLKDYLYNTEILLSLIKEKTMLLTAHNDAHDVHSAPLLAYQDLMNLKNTLQGIKIGTLSGHGFYPRRYTVNQRLTLLTDFPRLARWN